MQNQDSVILGQGKTKALDGIQEFTMGAANSMLELLELFASSRRSG